MRARVIFPGDVYGCLTVIRFSVERGSWECECNCGATVYKSTSQFSDHSQCNRCWRKSEKYQRWSRVP